ncbi:MAG: DUF805 domain-containing protein [Phycisphaerae bacterium]
MNKHSATKCAASEDRTIQTFSKSVNFWSYRGRANRGRFFLYLLLISLIVVVVEKCANYLLGMSSFGVSLNDSALEQYCFWIEVSIEIVGLFILSFPTVKRLHDINKSGKHYFLMLIPIYNLYLLIILLWRKGTDGSNGFGTDPLSNVKK